MVAEYIEARVRREWPDNAQVVAGSTPVISFGDATKARVATLGLNPSRCEFNRNRGLAAWGSTAQQVIDGCHQYFQRNPYRQWFDRLESVLTGFDASYYDGSACHLDLVQWATDPTWARLAAPLRTRLMNDDVPFLIQQLQANDNIQVLLVNGRGALDQLRARLPVRNFQEVATISGLSHQPAVLSSGRLFSRIQVLGWTTNLQSSFGVRQALWTTELPHRLRSIQL